MALALPEKAVLGIAKDGGVRWRPLHQRALVGLGEDGNSSPEIHQYNECFGPDIVVCFSVMGMTMMIHINDEYVGLVAHSFVMTNSARGTMHQFEREKEDRAM